MQSKSQDLTYAILEALQSSRQPMGSWSLYYLLRDRGYAVSAPTIGRRLRDMEQSNLVGKMTVEGRVITPAGKRRLRRTASDITIRSRADRLLAVLKSSARKDIIDQLTVRRIIEGESASLAALNASRTSIANLEKIVANQRKSVKRGEMGVGEDVGFHEALAKASGNKIVFTIVHLLRSQNWMNYVITAIRARVGTRLVVDHEEIIAALKERNASLSRKSMEAHISKLIADVQRYWKGDATA